MVESTNVMQRELGIDMEYSILSKAASLSTTCSPELLLAPALLFLPWSPLDQAGLCHPVKIRKWKQLSEKPLSSSRLFLNRKHYT